MFEFALLVGIYSYILFALGLLGKLKQLPLAISLALFVAVSLLILVRSRPITKLIKFIKESSGSDKFILFLLILLILVNFIGAFGPETAFDSLWYHLTIPKIYLLNGQISYIPGGLLYYSVMPKLIDILYIPYIALKVDFFTKLLSLLFSVLTLVIIYRTSKFYFSKYISLIVALVFYSNLVVAWQATTSFVDCGRTFFEALAFYYLVTFLNKKKNDDLIKIGTTQGLSIATKILAVGSLLPVFIILIWEKVKYKNILVTLLINILIPLPWLIFSFVSTGNPLYPFFSPLFKSFPGIDFLAPIRLLRSSDPISPIYFITLPLIVLYFKKYKSSYKKIVVYSLLTFIIWWISPQTGGGRFLMPYLPVYSLLVGGTIYYSNKNISKYITAIIIVLALVTILYRFGANARYIPVILGQESRGEYLSKSLNYDFGDFYDTDGYFFRRITQKDRVLTYNIHNLYYVDFPFVDSTWVKKGDRFDYVLVRGGTIPDRFKNWKLIYENEQTNVKLYSNGGKMWVY